MIDGGPGCRMCWEPGLRRVQTRVGAGKGIRIPGHTVNVVHAVGRPRHCLDGLWQIWGDPSVPVGSIEALDLKRWDKDWILRPDVCIRTATWTRRWYR